MEPLENVAPDHLTPAPERHALPDEWLRCICGARCVSAEALRQHQRRDCIGECGRLIRQSWRPIYLRQAA